MVKICFTMINNVNFFTIYESLLQNIIKVSPTTYKSKIKIPVKMSKFEILNFSNQASALSKSKFLL